MTLTSVPPAFWPQPLSMFTAGVFSDTRSELLIDAATEKLAFVFRASKSGDISKIGFRTGTVTNGDDLDVRLETVSLVNGDPTGTLVNVAGSGSLKTVTIADGDDATWIEVTLEETATVVAGTLYAIVFEWTSWVDGSMYFARASSIGIGVGSGHVYSDLFTGTWAKTNRTSTLSVCFYAGYDDGSFPLLPSVFAAGTAGEYSFNSGSTPDEIGIHVTFPAPTQLPGVGLSLEFDGAADIVLYDTDGTTPLETWSLDPDARPVTTEMHFYLACTTPRVLIKASAYRVAVKPTSGSSVTLPYLDNAQLKEGAGDTDIWEAMGLSTIIQKTSRTDAGGWTQDATEIPAIQLLLDQFDDGAGGGLSFIGSRRSTLIGR